MFSPKILNRSLRQIKFLLGIVCVTWKYFESFDSRRDRSREDGGRREMRVEPACEFLLLDLANCLGNRFDEFTDDLRGC